MTFKPSESSARQEHHAKLREAGRSKLDPKNKPSFSMLKDGVKKKDAYYKDIPKELPTNTKQLPIGRDPE